MVRLGNTRMNSATVSPTEILERAGTLLEEIAGCSGAVLYSGADTLVPGNLYVLGLNPGGNADGPKAVTSTIGQSLRAGLSDWNSYADEAFVPSGPNLLQKRIRTVFEALGADPRRTLTTNALFERTVGANGLTGPHWQQWWKHCWPVHQLFLSVVRPRVIVCLGNGPDPSSYELLRLTRESKGRPLPWNWQPLPDETSESGKLRQDVSFDLGEFGYHECMVLGLPHPSPLVHCWPLGPEAMAKVAEARVRIVGWNRIQNRNL